MKIARVYYTEYPGRQIGDIHDVFSPENHPGSLLSANIKEVEVGDDFDASVMKGVVAEDGSVTFEVDTAKQTAKALAVKQKLVGDAYNLMNTDVLTEMANVFGTTKPESASAYKDTWEMMASTPSDWEGAGLKASFAVAGFEVGDALDTETKVQSYANAKLAQVKTYGIWRMQRIEAFRLQKDTILAG